MLSTRQVSLATFALLLIVTACSDVVAPVVTKFQEVSAKMDNLLTCTNTWTNASGGNFAHGPSWSLGHVPNAGEDACITMEGNYTVTVYSVASVKSLTVSVPGYTDKPTLQVMGLNRGPGWPPEPAQLSATDGIDNYGTIELTSTGANNPGTSQVDVSNGEFRNHAGAAFYVRAGTGPGRYVGAPIVNDGDVGFETTTSVTKGLVNNAHMVIAPGAGVEMHFAPFTQAGGTFENNGSFYINQTGLSINGGTITGNPLVAAQSWLAIVDPSVAMTLELRNTTTLYGNVGPNQVLKITGFVPGPGWPPSSADLQWVNGLQNAGTIRLQSISGLDEAGVSLSAPNNGTIVNTGRIESIGTLINGRTIAANIDNRPEGTVDIKAYTVLSTPNGTSTNAGLWKLANSFIVQAPTTFKQNGGTWDATGGWQHINGPAVYELNGGTIIGAPWIWSSTIKIPPTSTLTGTLTLTGENTLLGDVKAGQTLNVAGYNAGPGWPNIGGVINVPANATNHGRIVMTGIGPQPGPGAISTSTSATLTNATDGRIDFLAGSGKSIQGNFTNDGELRLEQLTQFSGGTMHTSGRITGGGELRNWGGALFATGTVQGGIMNNGEFHIGHALGQPGKLDIDGYFWLYWGTMHVDIGGNVPGVDFDRMTTTGQTTLGWTLAVGAATGQCAGGGSSYEIITAAPRVADFDFKNGLNLGNGRTVTTVPGANNYVLNVSGPACIPPDISAPVIAPNIVSGTMGNNGWYTSDVTVSWNVTDAESAVSSSTGCGTTSVTSDNSGITFTCSATSAGGTTTQSVTIKRDATAPVVSSSRTPAANSSGWNNSDVTATYSATDALSGIDGEAWLSQLFASEGTNQGGFRVFTDLAGNSATAYASGISIDKTAPVVVVTRSPAAGPDGWNETDVTVTWSATDALSGLNVAASATQVFGLGANQGGSRTFTDRAGNSTTGSISGINVRTPPPPPPPPTGGSGIGSASPGEIWPPNNKMVAVKVTMCSGVSSFTLRSVTNDETGTEDVEGWSIGTADLNGSVRASRTGGGAGRTYTLMYDTVSATGATGLCKVTVYVPHDQGKKK